MNPAAGIGGPRGELPGLQTERTVLAWDRTAFGLLTNGALLLVHHLRETGTAAVAPAGWALLVMVAVAVIGRRRARQLRDGDRGAAAGRELVAVGAGVLVLGVGVLVVLVLAAVRG